jgi:hypothetical protein
MSINNNNYFYRAEFHLTKGPHSGRPKDSRHKEKTRVNRAASNNYEKKRNSVIADMNKYIHLFFFIFLLISLKI